MARYTLPSGDPQFFGSRGGSTFQRCGRVFSIRSRKAPVQKKTAKQTLSTNRFGAFASRWRQLTNPQKNTWSTFAGDYPRTDSLGNSYIVQRQALRIGANITQFPAGASIINTLVAAIALVPFVEDTFILGIGANAFDLVITPDAVQANCKAVFFVGIPSATQREFQKVDLVRLGIVDSGNNTSAENWRPEYSALFPAPLQVVGFWIPVMVEIVQKSSGQVIGSLSSWAHIEP